MNRDEGTLCTSIMTLSINTVVRKITAFDQGPRTWQGAKLIVFPPTQTKKSQARFALRPLFPLALAFLHAIFHPIRPKGRMEKGANFLPFHSGQTGNPAPSQISFPAGFVGKASAEQEL